MPNYIPKAEQIDSLNEKLTAINDTLKKKNDFTDAVKNLKDVTTKAEEATEKATAAAESVVSPSAKVTKSGDTATITITDKSGTTTAEVVDGSDAAVTKDNVVAALGYEPAKQSWELINDITLNEEANSIVVSIDSAGNAFKLRRVSMFVIPPSVFGDFSIYFGAGLYAWLLYSYVNTSVKLYFDAESIGNGYWKTSLVKLTDANEASPKYNGRGAVIDVVLRNVETIDKAAIYGISKFASGTRLIVYGIRA